jgi:hypothetical protein
MGPFWRADLEPPDDRREKEHSIRMQPAHGVDGP